MREIKFRAWESETEMGKPGNMSYNQEFCFSQILHNDDIKIMQFTGLLDKNGKEVYEGDIIEYYRQIFLNGEIVSFREVIEWGEYSDGEYINNVECWMAEREPLGDIIYNYSVEVIGNVYENPELLGKKA